MYPLYWLTLLIFVPIAYALQREGYPGNIMKMIENILSWNTTYNATIWFLLPYSILICISKPLFKLFDKKSMMVLISVIVVFFACCFISWCWHHHYFNLPYFLIEMNRVFEIFGPFILGACLCKYDLLEKSKQLF